MRSRHRFLVFGFVAAAAAALASGCRDSRPREQSAAPASSERGFDVVGVVRAPLADGQIKVEHEDIPGFMPAMTMPFYVADLAEAARLAPGDRVRFRFVVGETASRAERFEIIGRETENAPTSADSPANASATKPRAARLKVGDAAPDFSFVDQDNRAIGRADLVGRATLVTFIFTRCPVPEFCPAMTQRFVALQREIQNDAALRDSASLLSVTLDPEFDRPEMLKAYGDAFGADARIWRFATGDACCIDAFARAFSVYSEKKAGTIDHTLCTALIGPDGRIIELWRSNGWKTAEVLEALRATAASSGT